MAQNLDMTKGRGIAVQTHPDQSPAMTIKQAAAFLSCAPNHVFQLIHRGLLPYQRMGKRFVVPKNAVEQFLERGWIKNGK